MEGKGSYSPLTMNAMGSEHSGYSSNTCLLDYNASHYLTSSEEQFLNVSLYGGTKGIVVGNGNIFPISSVDLVSCMLMINLL